MLTPQCCRLCINMRYCSDVNFMSLLFHTGSRHAGRVHLKIFLQQVMIHIYDSYINFYINIYVRNYSYICIYMHEEYIYKNMFLNLKMYIQVSMHLCESIDLYRYECKNVIMHFAKHLSSLKSKMNIKINNQECP